MKIIRSFIEDRLVLLNSIEPKEDVEDVIFTIDFKNDEIQHASIYLIPYVGLDIL